MSIILEPETEQLADAIAARVGKTAAAVLKEALEARAAEIGLGVARRGLSTANERLRRSLEVARRSASRPVVDSRTADEILGYDDNGLPA